MIEIFWIIGFGLVLGMKHSLESDHIITMSNFLNQRMTIGNYVKQGMKWALGHNSIVLFFGLLFILSGFIIPARISISFEFIVAIMMIVIGIFVFFNLKKYKTHIHYHDHHLKQHIHFHSHIIDKGHHHEHGFLHNNKTFFIGIMHGLAGSSALLLMLLPTLSSDFYKILTLLFFSIGTLVGMGFFCLLFYLPHFFKRNFENFNVAIRFISALLSVSFGSYLLFSLFPI